MGTDSTERREKQRRPGTGGVGGRGGAEAFPREAGLSSGGDEGTLDASANVDGGRDGQVTFFQGDAGPEPPPNCVAPCVWSVVKHCIPTLDECVTDADAGPLHGYDTVTCDPTTGWSEFEGVTGVKATAFEVRRAGRTCFRWG